MTKDELLNTGKTYATKAFNTIKEAATENKKSFLLGAGAGILLFSPVSLVTAAIVGGATIGASLVLLNDDKKEEENKS